MSIQSLHHSFHGRHRTTRQPVASRLELITEPASEPLTLDELKDHARVDLDCDDVTFAAMQLAARECCEEFTGLALIAQTWKITLDHFPWRQIDIPKGVLSVTSFNVIAEDDTATLIPATDYHVTLGNHGRLTLKNNVTLPTTERPVDAVEIVWVAGFGTDWNSLPQRIRQGILQLVLHLYEHRGDEILGKGPDEIIRAANVSGAEAMWQPFKRIRIT